MILTPINHYHLIRGHLVKSVKFHHVCEMCLSTYPGGLQLGVYPRETLAHGWKEALLSTNCGVLYSMQIGNNTNVH